MTGPQHQHPFQYVQRPQSLLDHQYSADDQSLLARHVLSPLWARVLPRLPVWLAPNAITLLGTAAMWGTLPLLAHYTPTLSEEAPRWVYVVLALALILYQNLDALDGKQARRLGMGNCLGEFFDHGCDSLVGVMQVMMLAAAFRLGTGWETMVFVVSIAWVGFFAAHWEEFHTHRMILGPLNGPNEGIYVIAGVQILTAVYGSEVWVTEWRTFRTLSVFLLGFAGTAITIVLNVKNTVEVIRRGSSQWSQRSVPSKTVAQAMTLLLPVGYLGCFTLVFPLLEPALVHAHIIPVMLVQLFSFAVINGRLLVAHMAHEPFPFHIWEHPSLLVISVMLLNGIFGVVDSTTLLWISLSLNFAMYCHFVWSSITTFLSVLGCNLLTVPKAKQLAFLEQQQRDSKSQ